MVIAVFRWQGSSDFSFVEICREAGIEVIAESVSDEKTNELYHYLCLKEEYLELSYAREKIYEIRRHLKFEEDPKEVTGKVPLGRTPYVRFSKGNPFISEQEYLNSLEVRHLKLYERYVEIERHNVLH